VVGISSDQQGFFADWANDSGATLVFVASNTLRVRDDEPDLIVLASEETLENARLIENFKTAHRGAQLLVIVENDSNMETCGVVDALAANADDAVSIHATRELTARLDRCLRRSSGVFAVPLRFAQLVLDRSSKRAFFLDDTNDLQPLGLRNAEFTILKYLVVNRGRVVPLRELKEKAIRTTAGDHTVRNHVYELRKKLASQNLSRIVRTLPGVGDEAKESI